MSRSLQARAPVSHRRFHPRAPAHVRSAIKYSEALATQARYRLRTSELLAEVVTLMEFCSQVPGGRLFASRS